MKNLEQIRAKNALAAAPGIGSGREGGEVAKKVPTMIRDNGILATAAFAKEKREGYETVFHAVIIHLKDIGMMPQDETRILNWLPEQNSAKLRAVTTESLAYLNYLRRFVKRG